MPLELNIEQFTHLTTPIRSDFHNNKHIFMMGEIPAAVAVNGETTQVLGTTKVKEDVKEEFIKIPDVSKMMI